MTNAKRLLLLLPVVALAACGRNNDDSASEIATSAASGAMNNTEGSAVAVNSPNKPKRSKTDALLEALNPIGTAHAASWNCTGGELAPAFNGNGDYTFTPVSCSVTWSASASTSASWNGPFLLHYAGGCDSTHAWIENQAGSCSVTRTTGTGGVTRTLTGPRGGEYAVTHDSHGQDTGWDSAVTPAPSNGGVVVTCAAGGCSAGRSITINGSHLTATVKTANGAPKPLWDHTVSTGSLPLTVAGSGVNRVLNGTLNVQHNLAEYTASTTFDDVTYGLTGCCFPTSGTVTTTFSSGPDKNKTETLTFSSTCGEATLVDAKGASNEITLQHCL